MVRGSRPVDALRPLRRQPPQCLRFVGRVHDVVLARARCPRRIAGLAQHDVTGENLEEGRSGVSRLTRHGQRGGSIRHCAAPRALGLTPEKP